MKKILATILTLCMIATLIPTFTAMAASDFASEVPASVDATKTVYTYTFGHDYVGMSSGDDAATVTSYSQVTNTTATDYWKFAGKSGVSNSKFNSSNNGVYMVTDNSDAYMVMALYIPRAGKYKLEHKSVIRSTGGTLDMYFAKCPEDFTAGFPFAQSDKIANDVSFYTDGAAVRDYTAIENVVEVPSAGTYLIGFTDFNEIVYEDGSTYQTIIGIRLTETFAGEVPANAAIKTEYNYVFGNSYVGLSDNADVNGVTSYSKVTNTTATDYWKFAAKSDMANTTLNGGSNGVFINTNSNSAYMVMALYIPSAGKYNVSFDYIERDTSGTLDMYFAKCPDTFATSSASFPFADSDKIAEDYNFSKSGSAGWQRGNALDGAIEVPSAGTYLIGFTDSKINGASAATSQTLYNIKLTQTFASEVPASVDATKSEYEYKFGNDKVSTGNDITLVNSYSKVTSGDAWKFANTSGMTNLLFNGANGMTLLTSETPASTANVVIALYVPRAGKYDLSLMTVDRPRSGSLDVYFGKCDDNFSAGTSATLPLDSSKKIADDISFYNADTVNNTTYNKELGTVTVSEPGAYLIAFADFKKDSSGSYSGAIQQEIKQIKLAEVEEPVVPENPNAEITGSSVTIGLTAIVNGVASADAKALLSESSVTAGNVNSVTVGSTVTLKAEDSETLKFLYWYNGNSGRIISDEAEYTFTAGTNTPIFAKYADATAELPLTEYFSAAGQLIEESEGTFNAEPDRKRGNYYKLFKSTVAGAVYEAVEKVAEAASFVCWKKDGEVVSYNDTYTYYPWTGNEVVTEVTEGEASDVPAVVLFENEGAYMLELVNFEGVEIVEKGILFGGNLTISSCAEKAISVENKNQFTASSDEATARAYVIYRDGTAIRVAYSK